MIRCPWTHKYSYLNGKRCCSTPWKYSSGPEDDCDGYLIKSHSKCCPKDLSIPCRDDIGQNRRWKSYVSNLRKYLNKNMGHFLVKVFNGML